MKWFKHFTSAHDNCDLTKLRMKYGATGYAVYWYCLELIAGDLGLSDKITFELKHDAEVIAYNLQIDTLLTEQIMLFMVDLGLFESTHGTIICLKLAKYLDKKTTRNAFIHQVIDSATSLSRVSPTNPDSPGLSVLDKDRDREIDIDQNKQLPKGSLKKRRRAFFTPPTIEQVEDYITEKNYQHVDAERFWHFYESKNWMIGKNKMKKWKSSVASWEIKSRGKQNETGSKVNQYQSSHSKTLQQLKREVQ